MDRTVESRVWEDFKDALEHAAEAMRGQYDASITLIAGRPFDLLELIRLGKVEGDDEKVSHEPQRRGLYSFLIKIARK